MTETFMIRQLMTHKKKIKVRKTATGQGDDYTTGCLLHYSYFDKNCKLIAADCSKKSIRC